MTVLITLTTAGTSTGPFDLYSDVDGYLVPFETLVPKASLVSGYTSTLVPNGATIIRVKSNSACINFIDITISLIPTTTTTTTPTPTTTSTTTFINTTSTTTTAVVVTEYRLVSYSSIDRADACAGTNLLTGQPVSVYSSNSNPIANKTLYNDPGFIGPWTAVPTDGDFVAFYVAGFPGTLYVGNVSSLGVITSIVPC